MPESWDDIIAEVGRRTVHVACLPYDATLEKLFKCFSDFGTVKQVRLLKHMSDKAEHKVFKGTCLIELGTEEEAKAVLSTTVEYEDCAVRIQTKEQYESGKKVCSGTFSCFRLYLDSYFPYQIITIMARLLRKLYLGL